MIYQIFPDRFRNGRKNNDPKTGDIRYDDPVLALPWGTLPEGYCRNYSDGSTNCPWRFDTTPPADSPTKEQPRGRDYMGGDLKGVDQSLDYLQSVGVNTIYFNPVFDAGSNHSYDTQDYYQIDPYFGTQKDWENLVKHAEQRGMRIILDGVFNHMSSDSPLLRPLRPLRHRRRVRKPDLPIPVVVHLPRCGRRDRHVRGQRGPEIGDLRRLVRVRQHPGHQ